MYNRLVSLLGIWFFFSVYNNFGCGYLYNRFGFWDSRAVRLIVE
jgi:hypothetical protein